jgi:hypothetical protein
LHGPSLKKANDAANVVSDEECKRPTFDMQRVFVASMNTYLGERPQDGGLIDLIMVEAGPGVGSLEYNCHDFFGELYKRRW